jgi:long-subunit fatty acid transport protein
MKQAIIIVPLVLMFCFSITGFAQNDVDAYRYSSTGLGVGARALGMGTAYTGVANDYSAIYWNPAGLGQIEMSEFSLGLSYLSHKNSSTYFGNQTSYSNSGMSLNSLGMVYPFPTVQGSLVFAAGYYRSNDFTTGLGYSAFNPEQSIIQDWAPNGTPYGNNITLAEELKLASIDTATGRFVSPIINNLLHGGTVLEDGGINNWSVAIASEPVKNLLMGLTLNIVTGSYNWTQAYTEKDSKNTYSDFPFDFNSLTVNRWIEADISGFSAKFGLLYNINNRTRIGFTLKSPTWLTIKEKFGDNLKSTFDNGDWFSYKFNDAQNEYDIATPWVIGGGFSHTIGDLLLAADLEFTDWTQMEFRPLRDYTDENQNIKNIFKATVNLHAGLEYEISQIGLKLRGGFAYMPSPYKGDPTTYNKKLITAGLGYVISDVVAIDFGYGYGYWNTFHTNKVAPESNRIAITDEQIKTHNGLITLTYRF